MVQAPAGSRDLPGDGAGLERAKKSRQWIKDNGDYIPLASTWINQRQWTNQGVDQSLLPTAVDSGGWAPDPEVTT